MRYFVLPLEGLSDDIRAALSRGLGLSPADANACARHCARYGVDDVEAFIEELGEAQAAVATAKALGAPIMVDWQGRLCYDVPSAPERGEQEEAAGAWMDDEWLAKLTDDVTGKAPVPSSLRAYFPI